MFSGANNVGDVAILGGIVLVVLLLFVSMEHLRRQNAARGGSRRATGASLPPLGFKPDPSDERILSRLGWLLKNPADRHRLLTDATLFIRAARRAMQEGIASEAELLGLARRAGLDITELKSGALSTLKLSPGVEVSVADAAMNSGAGSIVMVHPETLRVRLRRGMTSFPSGTRLDVVCNSDRGLFRFSTTVRGSAGKVLHLEHSSEIEQMQRRSHRRHNVETEAVIQLGDGETVTSRTLDLSIGGAAIRNPRRSVATGTRIILELPAGPQALRLPGHVVRTSKGGRVAHLQFEQLPEASRHRLFRTILTVSRKK